MCACVSLWVFVGECVHLCVYVYVHVCVHFCVCVLACTCLYVVCICVLNKLFRKKISSGQKTTN